MKYRAFVSYSRKDVQIAKRLHRALERYRVPKGVPGADAKGGLGRFFRDDDELRASESLGATLDGAIDESGNLIVVASPDAAASTWVNKEINRFRRRERARILAAIVRGQPNSDDLEIECFPPALKHTRGAETDGEIDLGAQPLAANLTQERFSRVIVRLAAGLLNVDFDALWQRERRRVARRRALTGTVGVLTSVVAILGVSLAVTDNDIAALRDRSLEISAEQWRYFREREAFAPAFRAALASTQLDRPAAGQRFALGSRSDSTARAFALSGLSIPYRRLFGSEPDLSRRANYRDDIPGAAPAQRVAIAAPTSARSLSFSGDAKRLGATLSDGRIVVYDVASGRRQYSQRFPDVDGSARLALDETGALAVVGGRKGLYTIDLVAATAKRCATPAFTSFYEIARLRTRWVFAAATDSGTLVAQFDPATCQIANSVATPEVTSYNSHGFSDGPVMFVGYSLSQGLTLVRPDFAIDRTLTFDRLGFGVGQVKATASAPKGPIALGGNGADGGTLSGAQIVLPSTNKEMSRLVGHTGEIYAIDFLGTKPDIAVTAGSDFSVRIWDTESGDELLRLAGHLGDVYDVRFSPEGTLLATSSSDGTILLWDMRPLAHIWKDAFWEIDPPKNPDGWQRPSTLLSPEERRTTASYRGRPWDVRDWRPVWSPAGLAQCVRALLIRSIGWSRLDYARPAPAPRLSGEPATKPPDADEPGVADAGQQPQAMPARAPQPKDGPLRYAISVSGFALSDSTDGPESHISWYEVDTDRFLHINVFSNVPDEIRSLEGRLSELSAIGSVHQSVEVELSHGRRIPNSQNFEFLIEPHTLKKSTTYVIRVGDNFSSKDAKIIATHSFRTFQ